MKIYVSLNWITYFLVMQIFLAFVSLIAIIICCGIFTIMIFYEDANEFLIIFSAIHVLPQYYMYRKRLPEQDLSLNIIISLLIAAVIFVFLGQFDIWDSSGGWIKLWKNVFPQNATKIYCFTAVGLAAFIALRKWIIKLQKQEGNVFKWVFTFLPIQIITPFYTFFLIYTKLRIVQNDLSLIILSAGVIHGVAHYIYCVLRKRKYGDDIVRYVIISMLLAAAIGFFIRLLLFLFTGPHSYESYYTEMGSEIIYYYPKDVLYHAPEIFIAASALLLVLYVYVYRKG